MTDIKAIITNAANRYGEDPDTAIRMAQLESGLDPNAKNPKSTASGLFQFLSGTWGDYGNGRSPFDAEASADAGVRLMRDNRRALRRGLGREPTPGEIYMAHQQGAGGALSFLKNPTAAAHTIVGSKAISLNLPKERAGEAMTITAGDFAQLWSNKLGGANGPQLYSGGATTGSVDPNSSFRATDGVDPSKTQITLGETDTNRSVDSVTERVMKEKAEKEAEEDAPGFFEGAKLALQNEWSILAPMRALGNFTPDTTYFIDEAEVKRVGEGVPTQFLSEFEDAVSAEHADAIRGRIMRQLEVNEKLNKMGATGVGLQIAAAMTDPGAWAATAAISAATGGLGAPAAVAARFGRIGTVALGALEGAAGNLAVDSALHAVDPTKTKTDLMYSIGTGIVMGGIFSGFRNPTRALAEENDMIENIGHAMTQEARAANAGRSVGAAQTNFVEPMYRTDAADQHRAWKEIDKEYKTFFGKARFDLAAQLGKSSNPAVRGIGKYLVEDAAGNALKDKVSVIAASETQRRLQRSANYSWAKSFNQHWTAYRKANKISVWQPVDAQNKFSEMITAWQRADTQAARDAFPAEVKAAGAHFNTMMRDWWKQAHDLGITRTEMGAENYVPRITNREAAVDLINTFGYGKNAEGEYTGVTRLFIEAIKKEQPNIKPELADKMGYAIVDKMYKLGHGAELGASRALAGEDLDDFRKLLLDARFDGGNMMSEAEVDEVIANLKGTKAEASKDAGGSSRLKHRVLMDENFSMTLSDGYGTTVREVKISDFYVNNANLLMHLYNRNMSGQIALAGVKIPNPVNPDELLVDGIRSSADMDTLIDKIKGVASEEGKRGNKTLDTTGDEKNLRFAFDAIMGIPRFDETGNLPRFMRLTRDFNFTRLMGQVGFSQIPEAARVVSQMGVKTAYTALPEFRRMINMARSGKHIDELMDEIDDLVAVGRDFEVGASYIPSDAFGIPQALASGSSTPIGKAMDWIEPRLHQANRAVAMGSLMAPINATLQKWSARAFAQKFGEMAKGGKGLTPNRMRLLGLDDDKIALVKKAFSDHAEYKGRRLTKLNVGDWPTDARKAYTEALNRASRNMILENDVGQFAKWMNSPLGKVFLQFRSFAVGAWTRGLMQGLNQRDITAGVQLMLASITGSLVYWGQTHLQLLGDPDRSRKMRERLSWSNLGIAGVMRSSESSLLPMLIDTGASFTVGESVLDYRSSGLTGTLFGNPTADLLFDKLPKATSGIVTAAFGDDYSRHDAKAATDVLPFQRLLPVQWFFNWAMRSLPRRELAH